MNTNEIEKEVEMKDIKIKRGDIFFADLSPVLGTEIGGMQYVVVIQNDELNDEVSFNGATVIVAPLSSNSAEVESQTAMATIPADIPELSIFSYQILLYGIRAIDTNRLKDYVGRLSEETMGSLGEKIKYALGLGYE